MKIHSCDHQSHHAPQTVLDKIADFISEAGLKVTNHRMEILKILSKKNRPLSSDEIFTSLKKKSSDRVTVFRNVVILEEAGLLHRHDFGDGIRRYELVTSTHHHHFIICKSCKSAEPIEECFYSDRLNILLQKKGYKEIRHTIGVFALCRNCQ
jgi:Fur family ferric uptake transcriptional regulator